MSYLDLNKDVTESLKPYLGEQKIVVKDENTEHGYRCELTIVSATMSYKFDVSMSSDSLISNLTEAEVKWITLLPGFEVRSEEFPTVAIHESGKFFIELLHIDGEESDVMSSLVLEELLYDKFKAWFWRAISITLKKALRGNEFDEEQINEALGTAKGYLEVE